MALFTGKGDGGTTKVLDSRERMSKSSALAEALGALDELNSYIGLCKAHARESELRVGDHGAYFGEILEVVQQALFIVQAQVAGAPKKIDKRKVAALEKIINTIEAEIPPIRNFSIAGGCELSAHFDIVRTISRRTERRVVAVHEDGTRLMSPHSLAYLNRLSSLLFALARLTNHKYGIKESSPTYK